VSRLRPLLPLLAVLSLATATGCTYSIHQVHATDYLTEVPRGRSREISAEATQDVILYLTTSTDYVDQAYERLLAQCPGGEIVGIHGRHSTAHSFLSFTNKLVLRGLCVE
jgi:hypothetical protein